MHPLYDQLPLDPSRKETRFLRILYNESCDELCAELYIGPLDEHVPSFRAISYAWGDAKPETSETTRNYINVNGHKFEVANNVHTILKRIQAKFQCKNCAMHPLDVWIDSICINQESKPEKNMQVPLMGDIYSKASHVIVWLGSGNKYTDLAVKVMTRLGAWKEGLKYIDKEDDDKATLEDIYSYNRQILVMGGFVGRGRCRKSHCPMVICGDSSIGWDHFMWSYHILSTVLLRHQLDGSGVELPKELQGLEDKLKRLHDLSHEYHPDAAQETRNLYQQFKSQGGCLDRHVYATRMQLASDRRDKIYGLLGLTSEEVRRSISVDYAKSEVDVFIDFFKYSVLSKFGFQILSSANGPTDIPGWPTWIFCSGENSNRIYNQMIREYYERCSLYKASLGLKPIYELITSNRGLVVYGVIIDEVSGIADTMLPHPDPEVKLVRFNDDLIFDFFLSTGAPDEGDLGQVYCPRIPESASRHSDEVYAYVEAVHSASTERYTPLNWRFMDNADITKLSQDPKVGRINSWEYKKQKRMEEALWRVIIGDNLSGDEDSVDGIPAPRSAMATVLTQGYNLIRHRVRPHSSSDPDSDPDLDDDDDDDVGSDFGSDLGSDSSARIKKAVNYKHMVAECQGRMVHNRRAFRTSNRFIGFGPEIMEPGDKVVVIAGADVPFVLRPCGTSFSLIGECYVEGLMQGELFQQYPEFERGEEFLMKLQRFTIY
ncbi:heterokaryon incompatibility protein-domain-containing protein [Daldinia vernicosa]|uniref:heterokaryon incompatibility protein-domain-containing protein n=1 Tax=Daldinia vernicosa TaxID=114800 RepID=UPI0020080B58|nr:heterokaryon incompatibility protein-domain-containing protein [Daldinia vernicosa]KAI0852757.1 heterokaryon incompatibility protein-domain-containing protein [Daldinia vernicosa]